MPFVRISLLKGKSPEYLRALSDGIHRALVEAFVSGDVQKATEIHQKLLPVYTGMFRTQGVMTSKAALALQGLPGGPLRLPMVSLSPEEIAQLKIDLAAGGVQL